VQKTISTNEIIRPTNVEVNIQRLKDNFAAIKNHVNPARIMPVLKANAYGHGLVKVARIMEELQADYLGVAVLEEGILLRQKGIKSNILVLGGILGNQIPHFVKHNLTITASSIEKLFQINEVGARLATKIKVHLKFDTGMERIGVHYYNAESFIKASSTFNHIEIEGIYSHFADSDSLDPTHTKLQLQRFKDILKIYPKLKLNLPPLRHIANSGAVLQFSDSFFNMVRPGIMLYGVYPSPNVKRSVFVKPALSWKSRVVYFKVISPQHPVGYGLTWQCNHPVRAVTIPVGYGDGYFRSMSHKAQVIIKDKKFPVIGRISMDQIVVNLESDSAYNNDEVVLIGETGSQQLSCEMLAEWANTSPYEILTNINTRVPRIYKEDCK